MKMKHTLLIGTDFRRSSLKMRESIHFDADVIPHAILHVKRIPDVDECVVLTTCHRLELYIVTKKPKEISENILRFLAEFHSVPYPKLKKVMYTYQCEDAVRHLFRVATGLESMVIGEQQILGQIKDAYELSKRFMGSGPILNKLFQTAISVGKLVRKKTEITQGITSIGSAAATLAIEIAPNRASVFAVIGCGTMGTIVARHLAKKRAGRLILANRTQKKAKDLAKELGAESIAINSMSKILKIADVLITATKTKTPIITKDMVESQIAIIDIGSPRNVSDDLCFLVNAKLYTIDDLQKVVDGNLNHRRSSETQATQIIEDKLSFYTKWYEYKNSYEKNNNDREQRITPCADTVRTGSR